MSHQLNTSMSTAHLVALAQEGDEQATATLYRKHSDSTYRFVLSKVGGHDRATADDIHSDTWVKVLRTMHAFTPDQESSFLCWVLQIARNTVRDHFRRIGRNMELLDADLIVLERSPCADLPTEVQAEQRELAGLLAGLLLQLPERQRAVLFYRFNLGLNLIDTAAMLGSSVPAVQGLQHRALNAVARLMPANDLLPGTIMESHGTSVRVA